MPVPPLFRKKVAYVGQFQFPHGEAASYRTLGIAQSLRSAEYNTIFCTGQIKNFHPVEKFSDTTKFPFEYINFSQSPMSPLNKIPKYLLSGYNTAKWLDHLRPRPSIVIIYGGYALYAAPILAWCNRNHLPVIADVVEWYQPSHLPGGSFGPFRWNVEIALRYYYPRFGNIIAISKYLEQYYQMKGCRTLRIPPTLDTSVISPRIVPSSNGPLTLAYTGTPGKKDLLNNVLEALIGFDPSGKTVKLIVAGPEPDQIIQSPAFKSRGINSLPPIVDVLGRVSREEAMETVRLADFSVLLRPQLRYAQAGFPTKVAESLAVGTPIMCNLSSDLSDYIHDGKNGLVCRDHTPQSFTDVLNRALKLTPEQKQTMRQSSRWQAEHSFDFRNYVEPLKNFLQNVSR